MAQKQQNRRMDYVTSLLTGTFIKVKTKVGDEIKIKEVFSPSIKNENSTLIDLMSSNADLTRPMLLDQLKLVPPLMVVNREEFVKTPEEWKKLKTLKEEYKKSFNKDEIKSFRQAFKDHIPNWGCGSSVTFLN